MPRYTGRINNKAVIKLFVNPNPAYKIDLETGILTNAKTGSVIKPFGDDSSYAFIRLYAAPLRRTISVHNLVWMIGTKSPIPKGFVIHYIDHNNQNNAFSNLLCIHKKDHEKVHNGRLMRSLIEQWGEPEGNEVAFNKFGALVEGESQLLSCNYDNNEPPF